MVSMKDIAKQCNVSVASVSKALNGYSDISEETRQLIFMYWKALNALPNPEDMTSLLPAETSPVSISVIMSTAVTVESMEW